MPAHLLLPTKSWALLAESIIGDTESLQKGLATYSQPPARRLPFSLPGSYRLPNSSAAGSKRLVSMPRLGLVILLIIGPTLHRGACEIPDPKPLEVNRKPPKALNPGHLYCFKFWLPTLGETGFTPCHSSEPWL